MKFMGVFQHTTMNKFSAMEEQLREQRKKMLIMDETVMGLKEKSDVASARGSGSDPWQQGAQQAAPPSKKQKFEWKPFSGGNASQRGSSLPAPSVQPKQGFVPGRLWVKGWKRAMLESFFKKYAKTLLGHLGDELSDEVELHIFARSKAFAMDFPDPQSAREARNILIGKNLKYNDIARKQEFSLIFSFDQTLDERNSRRFLSGLYGLFQSHMVD